MTRRGLRGFAKRHWMARVGHPAPPGDEDLFVDPPSPDAVARRAAILSAVVARALIEADDSIADAAAVLAGDLAFYDDLDLARDAEPHENALVRAPHGTLGEQAVIDATWRSEGLLVLAWALGHLQTLPPIDEKTDLAQLAATLGLPWSSAQDVTLVRSPHLRPAADVEALDVQLLTAHWRVRQFLQIAAGPMDYVAFVPGVEWAPLSLDGLEVAGDDLAIGGRAIAEADPEHVGLTASILVERRLAVSWLNGYDTMYSEGDTNT